jgi:hypothetical protein
MEADNNSVEVIPAWVKLSFHLAELDRVQKERDAARASFAKAEELIEEIRISAECVGGDRAVRDLIQKWQRDNIKSQGGV